jgi:hypothetical protein
MQTEEASRFPHAGWLGVRLRPWFRRKAKRRVSRATKQLASQADLEALRAKFAKTKS